MARNMHLATVPVYRAVILYRYAGMYYPLSENQIKWGATPVALPDEQVYTTGTGEVFRYHTSEVYGPYGTKGTATASLTRERKHSPDADEIHAFVEMTEPLWSKV